MRRAVTMAMIAMSAVATACGPGATQEPARPSYTSPTTTTAAPIDGTEFLVAHEFWHSGFHVKLTKAEIFESRSIYASRISYWIRVWGDFENQGAEPAMFDAELAIEVSGGSYTYRRGQPPQALPDRPALGYLTIAVGKDFDYETAVLVVGAVGDSQARIPLGSSGATVLLEPTDVEVSGRLDTDLIDFDFTSASLRYDLPDLHRQLELGKRALTLSFDITSRIPGDTQISPDDVSLVLPDGSILAPAVAELGSVPGNDDGVTTADRSVSFIVDEIPAGDFTLRLALDALHDSEDDISEAAFDFSL